ncbi:hypothetical protein BU15DRAFT_43219 [Melanogaster broomeanus]|nr:hypothetical protein BU15DRAFT_43219 [Melanogaster broomeanus]
MAVVFRLARLNYLSHFWYSTCAALVSSAVPSVSAASFVSARALITLQDPSVILNNNNGTTAVFSSATGQEIPQGNGSDGSGSGFSTSAILWIVFSFVIGLPLLLAGFRGSRITIGVAVGTAAALTSWAVFVNILDNVGVPDVTLTLVVLALFGSGFLFGLLQVSQVVGVVILGILGGLAIGIRIVLLRSGLLVPESFFFVNWVLIGICGLAGGILVAWKQRIGVLNGCASTGSFLCALGIDLAVKQQSGMSHGLRYLFDRNQYHVLYNLADGYSPPLATVIILAVSLGITPAFAYAQWAIFKRPFSGTETKDLESLYGSQELDESFSQEMPDMLTTEKSLPERRVTTSRRNEQWFGE